MKSFIKGFLWWDYKYLRPFFIRRFAGKINYIYNTVLRFTQQELKEGKLHVTELTDKWYHDIQASPLLSGAALISDNITQHMQIFRFL